MHMGVMSGWMRSAAIAGAAGLTAIESPLSGSARLPVARERIGWLDRISRLESAADCRVFRQQGRQYHRSRLAGQRHRLERRGGQAIRFLRRFPAVRFTCGFRVYATAPATSCPARSQTETRRLGNSRPWSWMTWFADPAISKLMPLSLRRGRRAAIHADHNRHNQFF